MEVSPESFWVVLPYILKCISRSRFVAVDLEMSGIKVQSTKPRPDFQEAYQMTRKSAQKFEILQVGLTCLWYDEASGSYTTRSFSIHLTPFFGPSTYEEFLMKRMDRTISSSIDTLVWLGKEDFDVDQSRRSGITYLSRIEEEQAIRLNKGEVEDVVDISTLDMLAQDFYERTRTAVGDWVSSDGHKLEGLFIENPYGEGLNGLQQKLVRQLIRFEFPQCSIRTVGKTMKILLKTERETQQWERCKRQNQDTIMRLVGVRYIFEALSGSNFASSINPRWADAAKAPDGTLGWHKINSGLNLAECEAKLKKSRPILVGHNMLHDLCFIHETFFAPLPAKLEDFRVSIKNLFPRLVDTKYMFTRDKTSMAPDLPLKELFQSCEYQKEPVVTSSEVCGYDTENLKAHDAGVDTYMTAVVFVRAVRFQMIRKAHRDHINERGFPAARSEDQASPTKSLEDFSVRSSTECSLIEEDSSEMKSLAILGWQPPLQPRRSPEGIVEASQDHGMPPTAEEEQVPEENYSEEGDLVNIPAWADEFWRAFGNKTRMRGGGILSFD